jgi:hypothetical protein
VKRVIARYPTTELTSTTHVLNRHVDEFQESIWSEPTTPTERSETKRNRNGYASPEWIPGLTIPSGDSMT